MDLFASPESDSSSKAPLAERMRPRTLDEVVGHDALLGDGGTLRALLAGPDMPSLIFWGPPGSGKTTLARALAKLGSAHFEPFSAVLGGVKEVREIVERARQRKQRGLGKTLLFVDEIHRFNKGQQDAFLPHVEDGTLVLVGATTENPSFALNAALLSRCRVIRLEPIPASSLLALMKKALIDRRGLGEREQKPLLSDDVLEAIAEHADGDARRALNDLEVVAQASLRRPLDVVEVAKLLGAKVLRHDKDGDQHYDLTSAFIKSMRGSDPDAALYYLARLLEAGDDPRFIARRMIIFASEDVGNADPRALGLAVDALQAVAAIGMPEARIILGQGVAYLATAPKSNAAYVAIDQAIATVQKTGALPVPLHLRNAPTKLMAELGHGARYHYPHDHGGFVPDHYLPEALRGRVFYDPAGHGYERHIADRLDGWRAARRAADTTDEPGEPG